MTTPHDEPNDDDLLSDIRTLGAAADSAHDPNATPQAREAAEHVGNDIATQHRPN